MNSPKPISSRPLFLLVGLLILSSIGWTNVQAQGSSVPADKPAATIKSIVVGDKELTEVTTTQATVTRAGGGEVLAASAGTLLFKGDVIQTFGETRVTVLFFDDPVSERDDEVIIKENSKVGISSTTSWWGKIWVKVKGAFNSNSTYVRLAAVGTEYEFNVDEVSQTPTLVVLEGTIKYDEGTFQLTQAGLRYDATAEVRRSPFSLLTNFAHAVSPQVQSGMTIDVPAGQKLDFSGTYHVLNDCKQTHYFEFRTSNTEWLKLLVQQKAAVPPRVSLPVTATLRFDATRLSPGQYRANVYAICVDCNTEPRCTQSQLDWPINLTVNRSGPGPGPNGQGGTQSGEVTPGGTQSGEVTQLQEMVFRKNVDQPTRATDNRVTSVLDWTNQVLLTAQPTYSTQNIIPHFPTLEVRGRNFARARENAILRQDPRANQVLGNVYSDWGQGQRAVEAYESASGGGAETQLKIDRSEAYRLTGRLKEAKNSLNEVPAAEKQSVRALNAAGNLSLAYAQVAADTGKISEAEKHLEEAKKSYTDAMQSAVTARQAGAISPELTTRSNLGEAYLEAGKLAQTRGDLTKAKEEFVKGQESLEPIQQANSIYPFPVTNLGRAYQGLGNVAHLAGNEAEAQGAYQRAERIQRQAINAHPDFAEAYFNLGDLFDDQGKKEAAKENYRRAIKSRPEQPDSYYPLAVLVQQEDRALAAALASTYLQLEPNVFKQGEKARDAAAIAQRRNAHPRPRPFEMKPITGTGTGTGTETGTDTEPKPGTVPDLVNKTTAQALADIQTAGYVLGKVDKKGSNSADFVISQSPAAGASATKGSAINLVMDRGIEVPDVIDDKEGTAIRKLTKDRPFQMAPITYKTVCKNVDEVIEQYPAKHTRAAPGTVVRIVMGSVGEDPTVIPNLSGRSREDAEAELRQLGLRFRRPQSEESDEPEGTVIKQRPDAGRRYAKICPVDEVQMTVAVPWIIVGDYLNLSLDEARRSLRSIGLTDSVSYRPSTDYEAGKVISQSPSPGSKARRRSTVALTVATTPIQQPPPPPPPPQGMPPVVGMRWEEAKSYLEQQFGLTVTTVCVARSQLGPNAPANGIVATQNPAKGASIANKPLVTLGVASSECIR